MRTGVNKICLVGGTGRSGTTILTKIFEKHPEMANVPEWRFLIDPDGIIDFYSTWPVWSPYHYNNRLKRLEAILRDVEKPTFFKRFLYRVSGWPVLRKVRYKMCHRYEMINVEHYSPHYEEYVAQLMSSLIDFSFDGYWLGTQLLEKKEIHYASPGKVNITLALREFLMNIMNDVVNTQKKAVYLEKNTWNFLWFDQILELLPESKMVHIFRDPRDVVASYVNHSWMPSNPEESAVIYNDLIKRWCEVKKNLPKESYFELSLEQLVEEPKRQLENICEFWGVNWDDALLNVDLSKSNSGRWQSQFSFQEQERINDILTPSLEVLGYE